MIAALNQRLEQSKAPVMPRAKTIVVSGASGLVGSALSQAIGDRQWNLRRLVCRSSPNDRGDGISWNPESGLLNFTGFSGTDAVVHLAGENIASGRWTAARNSASATVA